MTKTRRPRLRHWMGMRNVTAKGGAAGTPKMIGSSLERAPASVAEGPDRIIPLLPSFLRRKLAMPQKGRPRPIVGAKKAPNPQDRIIYSKVAMPLRASPLQRGHRTDSTSAPDVRLAIGRPRRRGINGKGLFRQKAIARWGKQPQRQTRNRQHCGDSQDFYGDVHLPI
jgi:hypothetical protein